MRNVPVLLLLLLGACATTRPSPFPKLAPRSDGEALALLLRRTEPARALYAELEMDYSGPEREGTFEVVCRWRRGGALELVAFKELVLDTRYLFEITSWPDRWQGTLEGKPIDRREFLFFHRAREALFLPGSGAQRVRGERATGRTSSGAAVTYWLERDTLRVTRAELGDSVIRYDDYRRRGGLFIPGRVVLSDGRRRIEARLKTLEINDRRPPAPRRPAR